jgi:hypothetical protein
MVLRIPRPSDVFGAAHTVAGLPADTIRLLSRLGGLIDQAETLLARADRLLDSAEQSVAAVNEATRKAEDVVARADATTRSVQQLTEEYTPIAERVAPLARQFVTELTEHEVRAAIKLADQLPALTEHVESDIMPILATLDRVGPDVHELLGVTRDLRQAILGLPGFEFFRRRGEDREEEPDQRD